MIFKKNIIEKISKQLLLPFSGLEQDWDLEMANTERINDFITFYESNNLDFEEKKSVFSSYSSFL
ncbi:hypothetical protein [Empedobacter brevis]|uniref:hypothetical protein n=1 Tax=Empedobacter brevis TaxID=247 RepID=UPI0028983959|nr:hypothetical protein [Empedobacter brevis]